MLAAHAASCAQSRPAAFRRTKAGLGATKSGRSRSLGRRPDSLVADSCPIHARKKVAWHWPNHDNTEPTRPHWPSPRLGAAATRHGFGAGSMWKELWGGETRESAHFFDYSIRVHHPAPVLCGFRVGAAVRGAGLRGSTEEYGWLCSLIKLGPPGWLHFGLLQSAILAAVSAHLLDRSGPPAATPEAQGTLWRRSSSMRTSPAKRFDQKWTTFPQKSHALNSDIN